MPNDTPRPPTAVVWNAIRDTNDTLNSGCRRLATLRCET